MYVIMPYFMPIGQTVAEIWPFFDFSRWRLSAILDLFHVCLDHPRSVVEVLIAVQNSVGISIVLHLKIYDFQYFAP